MTSAAIGMSGSFESSLNFSSISMKEKVQFMESKISTDAGWSVDQVTHREKKPAEIVKKTADYAISFFETNDLVMRTVINVLNAVEGFFNESLTIYKIVDILKPLAEKVKSIGIALTPLYAFRLGYGIYEFVEEKIDLGDFLIKFLESLALIVDNIVSFLENLTTLDVLNQEALKFLYPFDLIGIALGVVSLVSKSRGLIEAAAFAEEFEQLHLFESTDFLAEDAAALTELYRKSDKRTIERIYGTSKEELIAKIELVATRAKVMQRASAPEELQNKAIADLKGATRHLQGRVSDKIISYKVGITAATVGIVANSLLFISPFLIPLSPLIAPALPLLYAMKGAAGTLSFTDFLWDFYSGYSFERTKFMRDEKRVASINTLFLTP